MNRTLVTALGIAAAGLGAGAAVARRRSAPRAGTAGRPLVLTVNRPVDDVAREVLEDEKAIGPLADVPGHVDIELRPAPGGRGTEIQVTGEPGSASQLRAALRDAKQVIETGEVLRADRPGTAQPTPLNAPLRAVTARAKQEGRL